MRLSPRGSRVRDISTTNEVPSGSYLLQVTSPSGWSLNVYDGPTFCLRFSVEFACENRGVVNV